MRLVLAVVTMLAACDCVEPGYMAEGELKTAIAPSGAAAELCVKAARGDCVEGTVDMQAVTGTTDAYHFQVVQEQSAGGDQLHECNDKPYFVFTAANCDQIVVDVRTQSIPTQLALDATCR